jgi:hypothetical protein
MWKLKKHAAAIRFDTQRNSLPSISNVDDHPIKIPAVPVGTILIYSPAFHNPGHDSSASLDSIVFYFGWGYWIDITMVWVWECVLQAIILFQYTEV